MDFDTYDITPYLRAGDTTANTTYASGGDLVFLSLQLVSVTSVAAADLAIAISHTGDFSTAATNEFAVDITNNGPSADAGPITVTDTLPAGLTYAGFNSTDSNWSCAAVGQDVTCSHPGPVASRASLATRIAELNRSTLDESSITSGRSKLPAEYSRLRDSVIALSAS